MLAYQKVLKGILHVACASLGEASVTAQSSQPVVRQAHGLQIALSLEDQAPRAFMGLFELSTFFFKPFRTKMTETLILKIFDLVSLTYASSPEVVWEEPTYF